MQNQDLPSLLPPKRSLSEDGLAMACAVLILASSLVGVWLTSSVSVDPDGQLRLNGVNPWSDYLGEPETWTSSPEEAFIKVTSRGDRDAAPLVRIAGCFVILATLLSLLMRFRGGPGGGFAFLWGFAGVFGLATLAYTLAAQSVIKTYNLEYAIWALMVGMIISNTIGTPRWMRPAVLAEFYIKTGLMLLGAEVLMSRLLALGLPGVLVAWVVTPIVLVSTYWFGQKVLKMESRSLNMVISADMSVCGVSAAIAAAAACKAKKEELSLAIGISLSFTVVMMVVMPIAVKVIGLDEAVAGAWIGGTIDSTGAVAAAGATLGERALQVAATVKMIQNILIGVVAFGIATYWVTCVEKRQVNDRPGLSEIGKRFPRFVLGFLLVSLFFSVMHAYVPFGPELVDGVVKGSTKTLRGWFFCLAFVSIGLETRWSELAPYFRGGKPFVLYVCGQSLNLFLTLIMAYLMFGVLFKESIP